MLSESYYAPFVRGAVIARRNAPCAVVPAAEGTGGLVIKLSGNETEAEAALAVHRAVAAAKESPVRVTVEAGSARYAYQIAAGFDGAALPTEAAPRTGTAASRAQTMQNRVALVTGGAQGFGEEIVRGLCEGGALVFIADLNIKGAEALARRLNDEYGRTAAYAVESNVGDEASVAAMFDTVARTAGGLDLCVSNAGVLRAASILEQSIDDFKFVTGINYTGFAIVTKYAGLLMRRQFLAASPSLRWPSDIIQINSKSGLEGSNKNGAYAGGKFGGIGLVQSFAKELVEYGVKVNAICPGNFFDGPLWSDPEKGLFVQYLKTGKVPGAKTVADVKAFYESKVPMGRGCEGADVIKAIYYLVDQVYETGQALPVTGGQVMLH